LIAIARRGRLSRDDLVRRSADGNWMRAELVRGLFNTPPVAVTATSPQVAVSGRAPLPAKRSMSSVRIRKYWVMVGKETAGPFTGPKLRRLAALGKLKPHYLVSEDRVNWVPAVKIEGLVFDGAVPQASTESIRSTVWALEPPGGQTAAAATASAALAGWP
jgi:hypothetical protein